MRYITPYLFVVLGLLLIAPAITHAQTDAEPNAIEKAPPVKKDAAGAVGVETPEGLPGAKPPTDVGGGLTTAKTLWQAIKDKAWWLVAASGIFIVMLILQLTGLFRRMGKRLTWIVAGVLSFAAATCLAFDKSGFSWEAFLAFSTAGPTVAWLRGFVKKAVLNFQAKDSS